jgi:hypothetical protein
MGVYFATGDRIEDEVTGVEDAEKELLNVLSKSFVSEISMALTQICWWWKGRDYESDGTKVEYID